MTCFYELPDAGKEGDCLYSLWCVKMLQLLYGFNNKQNAPAQLIKTNGVGPKLALAILSVCPPGSS